MGLRDGDEVEHDDEEIDFLVGFGGERNALIFRDEEGREAWVLSLLTLSGC